MIQKLPAAKANDFRTELAKLEVETLIARIFPVNSLVF